jgi:TatD DNase family protein
MIINRSRPPLVDIGVNLAHRSFNRDRDQVIARAVEAGVETLIITGTSAASSREAAWLAARAPGRLYSTAGVHPHQAREANASTLDALRTLAASPQVVAIGECGLDFDRNFSPPDVQEKWFEAQLELASDLKMPVFLHERSAFDRFMAILGPYAGRVPSAVIHCFTGDERSLRACLDLGLYVGITGWIADDRRGRELAEIAKLIPLDRLMIETDAPFLLPRNLKPRPTDRRNEPAFLPYVLEAVARAIDRPPEEVAEGTTKTAQACFALTSPRSK